MSRTGLEGLWGYTYSLYKLINVSNFDDDIFKHQGIFLGVKGKKEEYRVEQNCGGNECDWLVFNGHKRSEFNVKLESIYDNEILKIDINSLPNECEAQFINDEFNEMMLLNCEKKLEPRETWNINFKVQGRLRNVNNIEPFINAGLLIPKFHANFSPLPPFNFHPFKISSEAGFINGIHGDGSMPFNVVTLSCTVVAFLVGTVFNVVGRKGGREIKVRSLCLRD